METTKATDLLMQILYKTAAHFDIKDAETVTFRKREKLLLQIKQKDEDAFEVMSELIRSQIALDRIIKDEEKQRTNAEVWNAEFETAQQERAEADMIVEGFFKENNIK